MLQDLQGNMDSSSQQTVFRLNLAVSILQMAQNSKILQAVPPSVTIIDIVVENPHQSWQVSHNSFLLSEN